MSLRREGGSVDGVGMRVYGAASFAVGEEVVLFIERRGAASYTVGMTQGKLSVIRRQRRRQARVGRVERGGLREAGAGTVAEGTAQAPRRLEDFEREVRSYAGASRK